MDAIAAAKLAKRAAEAISLAFVKGILKDIGDVANKGKYLLIAEPKDGMDLAIVLRTLEHRGFKVRINWEGQYIRWVESLEISWN